MTSPKHPSAIDGHSLKAVSQLLEKTNQELYAYKYALDESAIIAITDQKGIIQHVNENFCKISKYTRQELIGQDHRIINSGHHPKALIQNLWKTIAKGKIWKGELKNKAKDGSYYWVDTTIVPFLDQKEKPYQYIAIRSDITDRKLAELEIKRQTEQIENLLECITDGFIGLDKNLCYTYANKQIGELLNMPVETLIGRNVWEVFPDAVGSPTYNAIQKALTERIYICHEDYYPPLNLWQENRIYPTGEGLSIFIRDISKQKREEQHLKLLESVTTNTNDAILITEAEPLDTPGPKIIYVNEAFSKMTGYLPEEVIGKSPRILQGPKTDQKELKRLSKALHNWESCEVTLINYKKNGEEFWVNFSVSPVADEKGWYTHWISIERDVTEKRKLEEEYNQIFHNAPDIICTVGIDGYFKNINPALSSILEYQEQELLNKHITRFIHPDDQKQTLKEMEAHNKGDVAFYFECRCVTRSGKIRWIGWTSTPAFEDGLIFTVGKDITERKELETLLNKATKLAGIGGWEVDYENDSVYWSAITREIHEVGPGYIPDMHSGINFYDGAEQRDILMRHVDLAVKSNMSFDLEARIVTAQQHQKWVRVIGEPEFVNGKCIKLRGSFQDVTARKTSELKLKELNQNLQNHAKELAISNAELEQFAYVASHDLQEPLRMVTSFLSQLEKKYTHIIDSKGKQYIHFAVDGAKRMRQIILDLLEFSRIGKTEDNLENVNLNALIADVTSLYRKKIEDKQAKIIVGHLPEIFTYKAPLRQVFQNLIGNSLKYHHPGQPPIVHIQADETKEYWHFSVKDNGIGIDPQYFDKIFIIFQRLHNKNEYSGTGMGLALTKKIVENLGGKIWVNSTEGGGSTFHFSILK
ncbi:PAS domain S-box-containing protein [Pedobacter africanus]|uniref:PAS domain S-box-containing protein n=1 Tax=Pedobacter africanus TaxID=151894 RepID=A0ACC6KRU7_9SPHI|nr:PAS domain S-box protein [Pedobacter africanus]MDR6781941.1 PAS domain S-box-containing protein [Pedobacter africanus]